MATTEELVQHDKLMSEGAEAFTEVVIHKEHHPFPRVGAGMGGRLEQTNVSPPSKIPNIKSSSHFCPLSISGIITSGNHRGAGAA